MIVERQYGLGLFFIPLLAMFIIVAACRDQQADSSEAGRSSGADNGPPKTETVQAMDVDEQVSIAKDDLAQHLGISADDINVDTVRMVHWRSGAAGCPKPDMSYTMAIVPGILIMLRVDGDVYRYHAGRERPPFYCPAERAEAPVHGQGEEAM